MLDAELLEPSEGSFIEEPTAGVAESMEAMDAMARELDPASSSKPPVESTSRLGSARALLRLCELQLQASPSPARAARLHYEAARLLEAPLWDFSAAAEHYEQARKEWPEHVPTLRGLRRVQTALGRYSAIPALIDAEIRVTKDPARRAMLFYEKGCLYRDYLEDHREARAAFASAVELDPHNLSILHAVRVAELGAGGWAQLDKAYELTAIALGEDQRQRAAVLVERARLVSTKMRDPALATSLYESALQVDSQVPRAIRELKRLLYGQGRWLELSEVLSRESSQTEDSQRRALLLYESGRLQAERLGNLEAAIPLLEAARAASSEDRTILEELARQYEAAARYEALAEVLEQLVEGAPDSTRLQSLHRLGEIYARHLGQSQRAIEKQKAALAIDGAFAPALRALEELHERGEAWPQLLEMYRAEAEAAVLPEKQSDALIRMAEVAEQRLGDTAGAINSYQAALAITPGAPKAFKALVRLFRQDKEFGRLAELYRREAERVEDSETKRTYLFKLGRLEEDDLDSPQHAVATYRQILALEPNNTEAIHAVQRAAERAEMWPELAEALQAEAATRRDTPSLLPLWHRLGEVFEKHIEDLAVALSWYRKVLQRDDTHVPTLNSLTRVYGALGRFNDVLAIYQLELKVTPAPSGKAALHYKMAQLCETAIADEADALSNYRKALQFDSAHLPSLRALQALLTRRREWKELVRLVQMEAANGQTPQERARAKYRIGELYEHRLTAPDLALAAYSEAIEEDESYLPAVEGRTRLLELSGAHEKLAQDLSREAQVARSDRATIDALLGRAQVLQEELRSPGPASEVLEAVLEKDQTQVGALLALEHIYSGMGRFPELASVYRRQAEIYQHTDAVVAALRELGRVQETQRLAEAPEVAKTYLSLIRLKPTDEEVLTTLERLAIAQQDWGLLSQVDGQLAQCSTDAAAIAAYQTRLGESLEAEGQESALDTYRQALVHDTDSLAATRGLGRLAGGGQDPDLLAEAAEYEARVIGATDAAARLLVRGSTLRATPAEAIGDLVRAISLCPDDAQAAAGLIQHMTAEGEFEPLVQLLTHAAQDATDAQRRADLRIEIAKIQVQNLGDAGAAIASAQRAVKERPDYPRALMTLGNLYGGVRQWREAVRWLRQALSVGPPPSLAAWAKLELARILLDRLGDATGAVELLTDLVNAAEPPDEALTLLIRAQVTLGQLDDAASIAGKLVDACETDEQRAEAHLQVAKLELSRGDQDAALGAYQQAVALTGLEGAAAAEFRSFLVNIEQRGDKPQWQLYADALTEYLSTHRLGMGNVYLELARIAGDRLGDAIKSLSVLRQGIVATEDNTLLRLEMAQRLRAAGEPERAAKQYLQLLELAPRHPTYWRELSLAYKELGRDEQSRLALGPLVAQNQADQLEQATYRMRPPNPRAAGPALFDTAAFRVVDAHAADDLPTTNLVATLCSAAYKLLVPDWGAYGVSPRDRIGSRSGDPVRELAERIAAVMGVEDFDLYVHPAPLSRVDIELTETPALMVPQRVAQLRDESLKSFFLARALCSIARRTYLAEKLPVKQLRYLIAAAIRCVEPEYTVDFVDSETLGAESRRVLKALPWRSRKPMEEAARAYLAGSQTPLVDWKFRETITAARVATVLCDDITGATLILLQHEMDLSAADSGQPRGDELPAQVLPFAVSDKAMQLRQRLQLTMK